MVNYDVTAEDAQRIIDRYRGTSSSVIAEFKRITSSSFDAFTATGAYIIRTGDDTSYLLKVEQPSACGTPEPYSPNALAEEHALLQLVTSQTDVPVPAVYSFDSSRSLVSYPYLLLLHPPGVPLSLARASGKLSPRQLAMLELRTGTYLKQLHERVQNDWFGLPRQEKDELYSWQEAFTLLLEGLLVSACAAGVELAYEDVRRALSRAIGFFLFDDCEAPSLVSFTGDEHSTLVDVDLETGAPGGEDAEVRITSFTSFGHALWGDPLLETMFLEPSAALIEGYGGPLVVFARQKTKRLWYTLFLALMVLVQAKRDTEVDHEKIQWASETAKKCAVVLKDAPCY